jgi:pectinesterase
MALRSNSNKSVVYRCSMEGHEDTLYAENEIQFYLQALI